MYSVLRLYLLLLTTWAALASASISASVDVETTQGGSFPGITDGNSIACEWRTDMIRSDSYRKHAEKFPYAFWVVDEGDREQVQAVHWADLDPQTGKQFRKASQAGLCTRITL
jgi:hypothetical protein